MNHPRPTKKRRLPQFRLRTLLIVMFLIAVGLATIVGRSRHEYRTEREVVRQIEAAGGKVATIWQGPAWLRRFGAEKQISFLDRVTEVRFDSDEMMPEELIGLPIEKLTQLKTVALYCVDAGDEAWDKFIAKLRDGVTLEMTDSPDDDVDSLVTEYRKAPESFKPGELQVKLARSIAGNFSSSPFALSPGCCHGPSDDSALVGLLRDRDKRVELLAAQLLWKHHSCTYAGHVIEWTKTCDLHTPEVNKFVTDVNECLNTENIRKEIEQGDSRWGAWLAALRPHPSLVQPLIDSFDIKPRGETIYALGMAQDPRATEKLVQILASSNNSQFGIAKRALYECQDSSVEPHLIRLLQEETDMYLVYHICDLLCQLGTKKAIPELRLIADRSEPASPRYDVEREARRAIYNIETRSIESDRP